MKPSNDNGIDPTKTPKRMPTLSKDKKSKSKKKKKSSKKSSEWQEVDLE